MFKPIYIYDDYILNKLNWYSIVRNKYARNLLYETSNKIYGCKGNYNIDYINNKYNEYDDYDDYDIYNEYYYKKEMLKMNILDNNIRLISCNPYAIDYIEKNLYIKNKIEWNWLSINPSAIHILKANKDKINYKLLSQNSNVKEIFDLNTKAMRQKTYIFLQELCEYVFNPKRLERIAQTYNITLWDIMDMY